MKRVIFAAIMIMAIQLEGRNVRMTLQKAIERKMVSAKAISLGGYQGYCMNITLKNLSPDSLVVLVEPGRRINSVDDKFQDILVVREEIIAMRRAEEKSAKVKGYCCQASNCAPGNGQKYDVNKLADSNLVYLARFLNQNCFDANAEQHSIWALSNNHLVANIASQTDTTLMPLKQLVAGLKGEQLPWYSVLVDTYVYRSGNISTFPQLLRGNMTYTNDKEDYVTLYIYNEKGEQVGVQRSQWLGTGTNLNYALNIPLKGIGKGKYTVALKTKDRELAAREFEI